MGRREDDQGPLLEHLPKWTWDQRLAAWEEKYQVVEEYVRTHNTVHGAQSELFPDGTRIYFWIMSQIRRYNNGTMDPEIIRRLELLQDWSWIRIRDSFWKLMYRKLCGFFEENGHTQVPFTSLTTDGYPLGQWVASMRGRKTHLSDDQIHLLLKFPDWRWVSGNEAEVRWDRNYELAKQHHALEGNILLPSGFGLGKWLQAQRVAYRKNTLAQDRIDKLEALGMIWDVLEYWWRIKFDALFAHKERTGDVNSPIRGNPLLKSWRETQKSRHKKGQVSLERVEELRSLGLNLG